MNEVNLIIENGKWDDSIYDKNTFLMDIIEYGYIKLITTKKYTYYFLKEDETIYRVRN